MGVLLNKLKYGLIIILLLSVLYCINQMRTEGWDKVTQPVYGANVSVTTMNNAAANMSMSNSQVTLSGVDEATLMRPLATRGRVRLLTERCKQTNHRPNLSRKHVIINRQLFFCDIPKTGSSFLKHFLMDTKHYRGKSVPSFVKQYPDKYRALMRMIFVREPFSRLVSGYISKLFFVFIEWFHYKYRISKRYRVTPSCGDDLTFPELIKYIIHQLKRGSTDHHWQPHSHRCSPCQVKYNFIGKLRTANDDIQMIIDRFGLRTETGQQYWTEYQTKDIHDMVSRGFVGNNCTTLPQALERVWVAFQMRGVISHKAGFPYADVMRNKYPDIESFYTIILKSREQFPVTTETKKFVKKVVLRNAFSRVDPEDIEKIRELYYNDFYLYGYDMYPDFLTDKIPLTIDGWEPFKLRLSY